MLVFENARHFSMVGARMLRLDSMSLSFQAVSKSHLFRSIWCNRRLIFTCICNFVQLQIFLPNTPYPSIFKCSPFLNGWSQDTEIGLNIFVFSSCFRTTHIQLNLVKQETRFDLHIQSCPIPDFLTTHPLPLHFQMFTISQQSQNAEIELKLFQTHTYVAQFCVAGDQF